MAVSKVVYSGTVLVDLTADTVDTATLKKGVTAHNNKGERIVGTLDDTSIDTILLYGFSDGVQSYSDDGSITSVNFQGQQLVKTFSDDFLTCTTTLYDSEGTEIVSMTKVYNNDFSEVTVTDSSGAVTVKQLKM